MGDSTFNFCIDDKINANFDITWSFQYSLSGVTNSTGGFCTFLFNCPSLVGGGKYQGLGYAPFGSEEGVLGSLIGIMFYSDNTIKIKDYNFNTIYSGPLFPKLSPLVKTTENYNLIRFNLTNSAQDLSISLKDSNNMYYDVLKIKTNIPLPEMTDFYRIGFSYASPLMTLDNKTLFKLKDLHIQGSTKIPEGNTSSKSTKYKNYIMQSPSGNKTSISYNNLPIGSILY